MTFLRLILSAAAASATLAACASPAPRDNEASLQTATAEALGGVTPDTIEIINPARTAVKWTWNARHGGNTYACDADNQMRLPSCSAIS
jgi:ABC-type glycerol-3-phosphate transport system substrate-binding protein